MAVKPQIKANQLAKDLGIKSKDIVDIMAGKGIELKTQKSLEPHEFDVLFNALTQAHQIENIDDYIDGVTYIPSKLEKKVVVEKPAEVEKAEDIKIEKKSEQKPEKAEAKSEKSEKKEEEAKNAPKTVEPAAAKAEPEVKKEDKKVEETKPESQAPKVKIQPKVDRAEALARAAAIEKAAQEKAAQRAAREGKKPEAANGNRRPDEKAQRQDRPQQAGQRPQQAGQRPHGGNNQYTQNSDRTSQVNDRFSKMGAPNFDRQAPQKRDDRRQQQKPQFNNNRGGMGMDKDDYIPSAPREKFQPQAIVRAQTPKGGDGTSKKGAAKTVDIRLL